MPLLAQIDFPVTVQVGVPEVSTATFAAGMDSVEIFNFSNGNSLMFVALGSVLLLIVKKVWELLQKKQELERVLTMEELKAIKADHADCVVKQRDLEEALAVLKNRLVAADAKADALAKKVEEVAAAGDVKAVGLASKSAKLKKKKDP